MLLSVHQKHYIIEIITKAVPALITQKPVMVEELAIILLPFNNGTLVLPYLTYLV